MGRGSWLPISKAMCGLKKNPPGNPDNPTPWVSLIRTTKNTGLLGSTWLSVSQSGMFPSLPSLHLGDVWQSLEAVLVVEVEEVLSASCGQSRDATEHPTVHRRKNHNRESSSPKCQQCHSWETMN